ncbi:hypothetical protein V6N13_018919 [Hibiscus sabdariffa]
MGDSSTATTIDWRKLFAASSDQSLEFFPPEISESELTVKPPKDFFDEGFHMWRNALVGQFISKPPNFSMMQKLVNFLWGKHGEVDNKPLILRRWEPNMPSLNFDLEKILMWIHLTGIPLELFSKRGLSYIASVIGTPLYMDNVTGSRQRLAYAKVCVEISVNSCLPDSVNVVLGNGSLASVGVDVPWMPPKCSRCCIFGHLDKLCPFSGEKPPLVSAKAPSANVGLSKVVLVGSSKVVPVEPSNDVGTL